MRSVGLMKIPSLACCSAVSLRKEAIDSLLYSPLSAPPVTQVQKPHGSLTMRVDGEKLRRIKLKRRPREDELLRKQRLPPNLTHPGIRFNKSLRKRRCAPPLLGLAASHNPKVMRSKRVAFLCFIGKKSSRFSSAQNGRDAPYLALQLEPVLHALLPLLALVERLLGHHLDSLGLSLLLEPAGLVRLLVDAVLQKGVSGPALEK